MLKTWNKYKAPYLFILPFFLLFLVFQLIPSLWTIAISLTNWKGIGTPEFCGMDNYKKLVIDNMFWEALRNTVVYWITGLVFILALSVLIASLLNSDMLRGRAFFRTVTFLPNICAAIAMGLIFRMLFDENAGLINELMVFVGFEKVPWLTSTRYSRIPVIMLNVWRNTPWFTMIVFSGLLNISRDYYEAATVDGANRWKQFCYIFNESYILPGPGTSNTSLFQYMYESGFNIFNMGYASAIGVILIVILAVLSMVQMIVKKRQGEW